MTDKVRYFLYAMSPSDSTPRPATPEEAERFVKLSKHYETVISRRATESR